MHTKSRQSGGGFVRARPVGAIFEEDHALKNFSEFFWRINLSSLTLHHDIQRNSTKH